MQVTHVPNMTQTALSAELDLSPRRQQNEYAGSVPKLWQRVFVTIAAIVAGGFMLVFGVWSLLFSRSFAALIDFPPYNLHLLHDVGAFQIGIGVSVLVSLIWSDSIGVALVAFIVAGTIHSINHALDRDLGGHSSDQWGLGGLVLLAVAALIIHLRSGSRHQREVEPTVSR